MRWISLLFLVLLAPTADGQQAVPDTVAPERYYPLAVGNRWEYKAAGGVPGPDPFYLRTTIVADTTIDGEPWVIERGQGFRLFAGEEVSELRETHSWRSILRFDPESANVLIWQGDESVPLFPKRLDLPLTVSDGEAPPCEEVCYDKWRTTVYIGDDTLRTTAVRFGSVFASSVYAAGIGKTGENAEGHPGFEIVYAHVDGQTYSAPIDGMPNVPDPTPPHLYYPLGVGDQWIYSERSVIRHAYRRRTVAKDTVVGGRTYAVVELSSYAFEAEAPAWERTGVELLRFDPETTHVMGLTESGTEQVRICALGADFMAPVDCGDDDEEAGYVDLGPSAVEIGGEWYDVPSLKVPNSMVDPGPPGFAAGIGELGQNGWMWPGERLEYARVSGVEYGTHPVAGEDGPEVGPALALIVSPNPTPGPLAVAFDLAVPSTVTAEAFDALGRRVWHHEATLGAGRQRLALDANPWAPGLYVVRVTVGDEVATARVVRQ